MPPVGDEPVGHASPREAFDDALEVRMQQRLAARQAHRDIAEQPKRIVHDRADEIGIQGVNSGDVVPNAVGTTEITVLRQREAEQHLEYRAPAPPAAADWGAGLQRELGEWG